MDTFLALAWFGGIVSASGFFLVGRGILLLSRRRWLSGALHFVAFPLVECVALAGIPLTVLTLVSLGIVPTGTGIIDADESQTARFLAEAISEVMNASVWLALPGFIAGLVLRPKRNESMP